MEQFAPLIGQIGLVVEVLGVTLIVAGILRAVIWYGLGILREVADRYGDFRRDVGRSLLVGLEFLVAGDIIRTVVIANTISDVAALGLLVLVRTVLVFTIHLEVEGHWPWQQSRAASREKPEVE